MNHERMMNILLGTHTTEKSSNAGSGKRSYAFKVLKDATKPEIKKAIETLFKVKVGSVSVCNIKPIAKMRGRLQGRTKHWKKAYVLLKEGEIQLG